ncbi:tRNA(fMet)-specific endonuclease VapC [Mycetohabitans sp. B5]|uniref:Ribonuclease VapC n=1 Tax=Mycetohabitans endofungorum TaxID=417203 RepID=A0A2P5KD18_9BURK|nr:MULTISPECIES: tRNA(fMet)-specific endonuclease VapC [Mycetohabitans]MCG1055733.1 tRNA(fMet)-specific endonuclease VapC [Mycetohabitans sp. B5]PPB84600.1 tRNA(fMet)-specific endonuclease VapC [Mycetohabitans endofungorum]
MLKYMLDTNIAIYVIKLRPIEILDNFNRHTEMMCISTITYAELQHGIEKSSRPDHNRRQVEDFVSRLEILDYGAKAAAHYGDIRAVLEREGQIISVNELHIAAHARSEGLVVVTNNVREFGRVPGLRVEDWVAPARL